MINNRLLVRTISIKGVEWYIQNAESKNCQPGILYSAKLFFKNEVKLKMFPKTYRLKNLLPILQEIFTEVLQAKRDGYLMVTQIHRKR